MQIRNKDGDNMPNFNYNTLCHHGIKGQKWGIRRYQNEDGSLTAEGKQRYGVDESGRMSKEGKKLFKSDVKEAIKAIGENVASSSAKMGVVGAGVYATKKNILIQ